MLCSCNMLSRKCHPTKFPMSKWEADGIQLYILEENINNGKDLLFIDSGETTLVFDVIWHGNGLWQLEALDRRVPTVKGDSTCNEELRPHSFGAFELKILDENSCTLEISSPSSIPEEVITNKIVLHRTTMDLSKDDIARIQNDAKYDFCPTYRYGSKWISEDKQISVEVLQQKHAELGIGEVVFADSPDAKFYMKFLEYGSMAYIGEIGTLHFDVRQAKERWKCEYFKDYFMATIISSEYYQTGHILRFERCNTGDGSPE